MYFRDTNHVSIYLRVHGKVISSGVLHIVGDKPVAITCHINSYGYNEYLKMLHI